MSLPMPLMIAQAASPPLTDALSSRRDVSSAADLTALPGKARVGTNDSLSALTRGSPDKDQRLWAKRLEVGDGFGLADCLNAGILIDDVVAEHVAADFCSVDAAHPVEATRATADPALHQFRGAAALLVARRVRGNGKVMPPDALVAAMSERVERHTAVPEQNTIPSAASCGPAGRRTSRRSI